MFDGLEDVTAVKAPGEIRGQQFIIQNCKVSLEISFDTVVTLVSVTPRIHPSNITPKSAANG